MAHQPGYSPNLSRPNLVTNLNGHPELSTFQAHHISTALKMAVDAYKQKSADSGNGFGGGGGGGGMQRGASPLMDSGGLPGFGESSGYRAYQQQVGNYRVVDCTQYGL